MLAQSSPRTRQPHDALDARPSAATTLEIPFDPLTGSTTAEAGAEAHDQESSAAASHDASYWGVFASVPWENLFGVPIIPAAGARPGLHNTDVRTPSRARLKDVRPSPADSDVSSAPAVGALSSTSEEEDADFVSPWSRELLSSSWRAGGSYLPAVARPQLVGTLTFSDGKGAGRP